MPRTNTAAKKAARAAQAQTGKPYMQSRRETDQSTPDWLVQLGHTARGAMPYPFVIREDGETFGFIDYGRVIGFTSDPAARSIDLYWSQFGGDPEEVVGKWMVTKDRFTGGWATHYGAVSSITPAQPRSQRTEDYGGTLPCDDEFMAERLVRRAMHRRAEIALPEDQYASIVTCKEDGAGEYLYEVQGTGQVLGAERGIVMGTLEGFTRPGQREVVVDWDTFAQDPTRVMPTLKGLTPLVWVSDNETIPLGTVVSARVD